MKQLGSILLKGLVTILPIGLTVYFVYWLGITTESLLSKPLRLVLDDSNYWPGMGLVTGFLLLFLMPPGAYSNSLPGARPACTAARETSQKLQPVHAFRDFSISQEYSGSGATMPDEIKREPVLPTPPPSPPSTPPQSDRGIGHVSAD